MKIYILSNENFDYWDENYITVISLGAGNITAYESVTSFIEYASTTEDFDQFYQKAEDIPYEKHGRIKNGKFIFNESDNSSTILYQTTNLTEFIQYCTEIITIGRL